MLFTRRSVRENPKGLLIGAALVIVGLMFNRFNVSLFALEHQGGAVYVPGSDEFAISFGIISGGVLLFTWWRGASRCLRAKSTRRTKKELL
ncbi:MAG: hypothetical protein U0559_01210 [Anaerolineae bacterium]